MDTSLLSAEEPSFLQPEQYGEDQMDNFSTEDGLDTEDISTSDCEGWDLDQGPITIRSPSASTGRIFHVTKVVRATGGHRPSILCEGRLQDLFSAGAVHRWQSVANELQLSLRWEPPSPKFSRTSPEMTSYRLKLLQGSQFIYLLRGFPKQLVLDKHARAIAWGVLQLVFTTDQQLDNFLAVLKHVEVSYDQVWPKQIAALWQQAGENDGSPLLAPLQQPFMLWDDDSSSSGSPRPGDERQQQDPLDTLDWQQNSKAPVTAQRGSGPDSRVEPNWVLGLNNQTYTLMALGAAAALAAGVLVYRHTRAGRA